MKTLKLFILSLAAVVGLFILANTASALDAEWERVSGNIPDTNLTFVAPSSQNPQRVYAASQSSLFLSEDAGESWRYVFSLGRNKKINFISLSKTEPEVVYLATQDGLYKSQNNGAGWKKIFSGISNDLKDVTSVYISTAPAGGIYISTHRGVFKSEDGGQTWADLSQGLSGKKVSHIIGSGLEPKTLYAATDTGVEISRNAGEDWKQSLVLRNIGAGASEVEDLEIDTDAIEGSSRYLRKIAMLNLTGLEKTCVGVYGDIYVKEGKAKNWKLMTTAGLLNKNIRMFISHPGIPGLLYAATEEGVFRYSSALDRWEQLYKGLGKKDVRLLAFDSNLKPCLWAAADGGVFKLAENWVRPSFYDRQKLGLTQFSTWQKIMKEFSHEPTVQEVQAAAVRYAEVHPEKIQEWRMRAKIQPLLPDLSLDYDKTVYGSSSGKFAVGPEDWGFSFKWGLGDLIWNPSQTSIDNRSKLMVQLRDDVLDEVTSLYFERRRLQIEMHLTPPQDTSLMCEKQLRLQELTAGIDALTGGWFSRNITE